MESKPQGELLFAGEKDYVEVRRAHQAGRAGALLSYVNPDPRKLHAVDALGMRELEQGVEAVISAAGLEFCVFYGAYDPVHAGADITQFAGEPDYTAIKAHLDRGTQLDARIKAELWPRLRTVAVFCGDRYGGSVEWPLFAQYVVAASNTRLQFSEVQLGIVPGWNGVLNVLLRSNAANALYLGATGNQIGAKGGPVVEAQLVDLGLAQCMVETPPEPERRAHPPEEWRAVWAEHAAQCQPMLLTAALNLAVAESPMPARVPHELATPEELQKELAQRQNPVPYRRLRELLELKRAALGDPPDAEAFKALSRETNAKLAQMGKPLAPAAVTGIKEFVAYWGVLTQEQLLARYAEAAQSEADLCAELMRTEHRRRGVEAILTREPVLRVPVFD